MGFRRSSRCDTASCVSVDAGFRTSSWSSTMSCVEAAAPGSVLIRDSKQPPSAPMLQVSPAAWTAFLSSLA